MFSIFQARQACRLEWSGLPVYFYVRDGLTQSRRYYDAGGAQPLEQPAQRVSSWWCVNDLLGLVAVSGNNRINIQHSLGNNWARTPQYRDKCDGVFVCPVRDRQLEADNIGVDLAVVFYPNTSHERIAKAAATLNRSQQPQLPLGWKGLIAPDANIKGKRYLTISNLYGAQTQTTLLLSFDEGVPILSKEITVTERTGLVSIEMQGLESLGETLELYITTFDAKTVRASKETRCRYRLQPVGTDKVNVQLRYTGGAAESIEVSSETGQASRVIPKTLFSSGKGFEVELDGPIIVELRGPGYTDYTGPAVEITDIQVREDGRVKILVDARDQSGIESVEAYCDDLLVGKRSIGPFVFTHRPKQGWHSFYAVATDASKAKNRRTSFKRTIEVRTSSP